MDPNTKYLLASSFIGGLALLILVVKTLKVRNNRPHLDEELDDDPLLAEPDYNPDGRVTSIDEQFEKAFADSDPVDSGNPVSPNKSPNRDLSIPSPVSTSVEPSESEEADRFAPPKGTKLAVITPCGNSAMHWSNRGELKTSKIVKNKPAPEGWIWLVRGGTQFKRELAA
jgi:hypothetical protein